MQFRIRRSIFLSQIPRHCSGVLGFVIAAIVGLACGILYNINPCIR